MVLFPQMGETAVTEGPRWGQTEKIKVGAVEAVVAVVDSCLWSSNRILEPSLQQPRERPAQAEAAMVPECREMQGSWEPWGT